MKDIKRAILAEKQYFNQRKSGVDNDFRSIVGQYGYDDIKSYIIDRNKENIKGMNIPIYIQRYDVAVDNFLKAVKEKRYGIYIADIPEDKIIAWVGPNEDTIQRCQENSIEFFKIGQGGGTVLSHPNDLSFGCVLPQENTLDSIISWICDILKKYDNFIIKGNDILLNDKKIGAFTDIYIGNTLAFMINISFGDTKNYIKKICRKPGKHPGYIKSVVLTKQQFIKDLTAYVSSNNDTKAE